mmetsp:Transcript_27980/g.68335  ORF Transcript_27980/g.68335 Transcript_27980/m.68335 type:complete len:809 (+) Transcript_27980:8580-11006(+)
MERLLHLADNLPEVLLDVASEVHGVREGNLLLVVGNHGDGRVLLLLVEGDGSQRIKHVLQVLDDGVGVGPLREDLEEDAVGAEVEAREGVTLRLEVTGERLLAQLQLLRQVRQERLHHVVAAAALHAVGRLKRLLGDLHEVLVDAREALGLLGELLGNVARREDSLHVDPEVLHRDPLLDHVGHGGQIDDPLLHKAAEGRRVAVSGHAAQLHLRVLKSLHDLTKLLGRQDDGAAVLEVGEGEGEVLPLLNDLVQLGLNAKLLGGPTSNILDVLGKGDHTEVQHVHELARLDRGARLLHGDLLASNRHDALPVAGAHALLRALLQQGKHLEELVNRLLELPIGLPVTQLLGHALAQRLEAGGRLRHGLDLRNDVGPHHVSVALDRLHNVDVEPVELVEQLQLLLASLELGVLRDGQPKEVLPLAVRVPLALPLLEQATVLCKALRSVHGGHALHHGAVCNEVLAELARVLDKLLDVLGKRRLESGLEAPELVRDDHGLRAHLLPALPQVIEVIKLLLVHVHAVLGEEVVLLLNGDEHVVDLRLLLPDELEHRHDVAHVVEVGEGAVELLERVLHHVLKRVHLVASLRVKVLGVLRLPGNRLGAERGLDRGGLEAHAPDVVHGGDGLDVCLHLDILLELIVKGLEVGLGGHKLLVLGLLVHLPQVLVPHKRQQVVVHLLLGPLHGPREQEHHLDNLAVLRDERVEGLEPRNVLLTVLPPLADALGAPQHVDGAAVDGRLDLLQRGVHRDVWQRELHVDIKEGLVGRHNAPRGGAGGEPLLERVKRVLGRVENGKVHETRVVVAKLLHSLL